MSEAAAGSSSVAGTASPSGSNAAGTPKPGDEGKAAPQRAGGGYMPPQLLEREFMEYLGKSGVIALVRELMVELYQETERPPKCVEYLRKRLGNPLNIDVDALMEENAALKAETDQLKVDLQRLIEENDELNDQVENMEG